VEITRNDDLERRLLAFADRLGQLPEPRPDAPPTPRLAAPGGDEAAELPDAAPALLRAAAAVLDGLPICPGRRYRLLVDDGEVQLRLVVRPTAPAGGGRPKGGKPARRARPRDEPKPDRDQQEGDMLQALERGPLDWLEWARVSGYELTEGFRARAESLCRQGFVKFKGMEACLAGPMAALVAR
jgi:hypothetical protein